MAPKARFLCRFALIGLLVFFSYEVGRRLFGWNLHTVLPGRVYRGAQPDWQYVEMLAKDKRAVRHDHKPSAGAALPFDWYDRETLAVQQLGMNQEDICFSALRLPSSLELRRLVEVLERAEYPVFMHCRRGADRTGMAGAIVMLLQTDVTLAEARKQLSPWFGHVPLGKTRVLDQFFDLYEEWLGKQGYTHDSKTFRRWVLDEYNGGWCNARFEEFTPLDANPRQGEPIGYRVKVRNTGTKNWQMSAGSLTGIHLAYQIYDGERILHSGQKAGPGCSISKWLPRRGGGHHARDTAPAQGRAFSAAGGHGRGTALLVLSGGVGTP